MIAMVNLFGYPEFRQILDEEIMPYVEMKLPGLHFHLHKAIKAFLSTNIVYPQVMCVFILDV